MITNVTGVREIPPTPTFEQRLAEWRAKTQPQLGNAFPWKWLQADFEREFAPMTEAEGRQYEAEEMAAGREYEYGERGFVAE